MMGKRPTSRERQEAIHRHILRAGSARAEDVSSLLETSLATVRRDLAALERRGLVERIWGGARVRSAINYLGDYERMAAEQAEAKRAIAAEAAAMVMPGMVLGLSGGTTCTELARWLLGKPITVVTNAVNVATELYSHGHTKVILTGGTLNNYSYELVGEMVRFALQEYRLELCFLGCSGLTPDFGFSMRDHSESAVARAFLEASEQAVVIADHTKVGQATLSRFAPISAVSRFVTDEGLSDGQRKQLERAGLVVTVASPVTPAT